MSKFNTAFSGALAAVLTRLPKGSQIHSVTVAPNKRDITVEWENDALQTNYFSATDFPETSLEGELPAGVRVKQAPVVIPQSLPLKVDKKPSIGKTGKR